MKVFLFLGMLFSSISAFCESEIIDAFARNSYSTEVNEKKWRLRDLGTLSKFESSSLLECNDMGQVLMLGDSRKNPPQYVFFDSDFGLVPIQKPSVDEWQHQWLRINKSGLVVGLLKRNGVNNGYYEDLITWNMIRGYRVYRSQFTTRMCNVDEQARQFIARCRNSNLVVINRRADDSENNQVLILKDDELINITHVLKNQARKLGFDAGGWLISDVNSQEMLFGSFHHYEIHPYKDTKIKKDKYYFVQDAGSFYIVECPKHFNMQWAHGTPLRNGDGTYSFDVAGRVFFRSAGSCIDDSMIWTREDGLKKLESPLSAITTQEGSCNPIAICLLHDGTVVWRKNVYLLEKDGVCCSFSHNVYFLEKDGVCCSFPHLVPENLHEYPELKYPHGYSPLFQENRGFLQCEVFGESHPFMMEFKQSQ